MGPSYSNSFGNNIPQQPIMSAGTGDIILAPDDGGGKSRKGLVIVLIVLAVVLAGVGIWYAVWRGQGGGGSGDDEDASDILEGLEIDSYADATYAFANYILFNKHSTEKIYGAYDATASYPIWRAAEDHDEKFFKDAKVLYENMASWIDTAVGDGYAGAKGGIDIVVWTSYRYAFDLYYLYNTMPSITYDDVREKYFADGYDATVEYIDNVYSAFTDSSSLAVTYGELKKKADLLTLESTKVASENGCVVGDRIDVACLNEVYEYDSVSSRRLEIKQSINSIVNRARNDVVSKCFDLVSSFGESNRYNVIYVEDK